MNIVERIVRVVFKGVDDVSEATRSASSGIGSFVSKIPGWATATAALTVAYQAVKTAIGAIHSTITGSFAAFDELATSQRKLEGTSKLTGFSLEYLQQVAEKGRREFGLSRVTANDFAVEVAKLEKASGGAASASDLLNGFLQIGAARGLTAAQSMEAARKSILGIDEGTDALFGRNPSGLWADYATVIGKSVGKFSDLDKQAALAFYVLDGGSKAVGSYGSFLESAQGQQSQFNQRLEEAKATLGESLQPLRALALEGLGGLIEYLGTSQAGMDGWVATLRALLQASGEILKPVVVIFSALFDGLSITLERSMIEIRRWAYGITNTVGRVLSAFGVEFGDVLINQAQSRFFKLNEDFEAFQKRSDAIGAKWRGDAQKAEEEHAKKIVGTVTKKANDVVAVSEAEKKKLETISEQLEEKILKMFDDSRESAIKSNRSLREAFGDSLTVSLAGASDAIQKIRDRLVEVQNTNAPDEVKRLTQRSEGYIETLRLMNDAHKLTQELDYGLPPRDAKERLQSIVEKLEEQAFLELQSTGNAEDYRKRLDLIRDLKGKLNDLKKEGVKEDERANKEIEKTEKTLEKMFDNVSNIARGALDLAQAFGVVDRDAASALTSVINIATSLQKIAGGDVFAGVSGLLGGVANIVSVMMQGDRERRELTRQNTAALVAISRDGVRLSTSASGDQIAGIANFLTPEIANQLATMTSSVGRAAGNQVLVQLLAKAGLRLSDLDAVASDLGMNLRRENGQIDLAQLPILLQALQGGAVQDLMNVGDSFGDRLDFFREGQSLRGVTGIDAAKNLFSFLGQQGVAAFAGIDLNDPAAARQQLLALFDRLGSPEGLAPGLLGPATGEQLRELIGDMIRLLDSPASGSADSGSTGIPPLTIPGDAGTPSTGGGPIVTGGYADLIDAIGEQKDALAGLLTESLSVQREIAHNTSSGWEVLHEIRGLRADIAGGRLVDGVDAALETRRRSADLSRGRLPSTV